MNQQLIYPMAFYVFYMWGLAGYMFFTRLNAIKTHEVPMRFFKTYSGSELKDKVIVTGRHYDNQFQVPILFLITCAVFLAMGQVSQFTLVLAWLFVVTRLAHSFVHLGANNVRHRVIAFASGWITVLMMWGHLVYLNLK